MGLTARECPRCRSPRAIKVRLRPGAPTGIPGRIGSGRPRWEARRETCELAQRRDGGVGPDAQELRLQSSDLDFVVGPIAGSAAIAALNLLNWAGFFEPALAGTGLPVALLRAAWFMENAAWDLPAAREGRIASYLQPVDRAIEMVSTHDVGRTAADLLRKDWTGTRIIELAGPGKYSPNDEAAGFAAALGRPVEAVAVPREGWEARFRAEGMRHPEARIAMLDGFNEGWIDFARKGAEHRTGTVAFETVLRHIVERG